MGLNIAFNVIHEHVGWLDVSSEATKLGAYDYVLKPFEVPEMLNLIKQAMEAGYCMRSPVEVDVAPGRFIGDAQRHIGKVEQANGNRSQAAKLLGVSRPTLHAKIDKYKIKLKTEVSG